MIPADVVPVAVPHAPGEPSTVTVPAGTHLLHWCVLRPTVPTGPDRPDHEVESRRHRNHTSLVEAVDPTLAVDGSGVGAVADVVRSEGDPGMGYWNVTEPLPVGTYTTTLTLAFDPEAATDSPPPCVATFDERPVRWDDDGVVTMRTTTSVVPEDEASFERGSDPLWRERDVYRARYGGDPHGG